ncbi:MAG: bifunctional phosphoglucose/phosphomannose isomerase [Methanomassiliicoccaceae archaeon]|nr:bifunctional phosphoglucose/phosphomannose isomerase [Methanomassiliicoccaceae archaeon]
MNGPSRPLYDDDRTIIFNDPTDMPEQIEVALNFPMINIPKRSKVCICGMGASAMAGEIMSDFADESSSVPITVVRNAELPKWVDEDTAVIVMSYAGDTPETLALYDQALVRGCGIVCITSGGKLMKRAEAEGSALIEVPPGLLTRGALGYMLGCTASVFEEMGICGSRTELNKMLPSLKEFRDSLTDDGAENEAMVIARTISEKIPVIYSLVNMRAAAIRWKMQINENSRMMAFCGTIPEFNHNEIMGWTEDKISGEFIPIIICDNDPADVLKFMTETLCRVLKSNGINPYIFKVKGSSDLEKNLISIILGDLVSIYLAYMNGVYPGEIRLKSAGGPRKEFN